MIKRTSTLRSLNVTKDDRKMSDVSKSSEVSRVLKSEIIETNSQYRNSILSEGYNNEQRRKSDSRSTEYKLKTNHYDVMSDNLLTDSNILDLSCSEVDAFPLHSEVRIETLFSEKNLKNLEQLFSNGPLTMFDLKGILMNELKLSEDYADLTVPEFFSAINSYNADRISFRQMCDHLGQEYEQRRNWSFHVEDVCIETPARVILPKVHHKTLPTKVLELGEDMHLLFGQDGFVSFWSSEFSLRKCRSIKTREIEKERQFGKWYIDAVVTEDFGKVIISTGDKELQFYELPSMDPSSQLMNIPSIAQTIDCKTTAADELTIVYGDWVGCVTVIVIINCAKILRQWSDYPKRLGFPTLSFEQAYSKGNINIARWQVHSKRVVRVRYTHALSQLISCSTDPGCSIAIGCSMPPVGLIYEQGPGGTFPARKRPRSEEISYKVCHGIRTIDVWEEKRLCAAAGIDRIIRIWSTMARDKTPVILRGHLTPIFQLSFHPPLNILVSFGTSKSIRLWNLKDFVCIVNITEFSTHIKGNLLHMFYCSKISNSILIQTSDDLYSLYFCKRHVDDESHGSHFGPIKGAAYNEVSDVWITCSTHLVKLWDVLTGKKKYEFQVVMDETIVNRKSNVSESRINEILNRKYEEVVNEPNLTKSNFRRPTKKKYFADFNRPGDVTCLFVDKTGRKLLTGHQFGVIKEINFQNGMVLRNFCKGSSNKEVGFSNMITGVTFVHTNKGDNIVSVGWNKTIDVYGGPESKESVPYSVWDAVKEGHNDDLWTVTVTEPGILATGSYDGLVILWNFVSGHPEARLKPPDFCVNERSDFHKVTALLFYHSKVDGSFESSERNIYLFTAGPGSGLHMWEIIWHKRHFFYRGRSRPWRSEERFICSLSSSSKYKLLIAGDDMGTIFIFTMKDVKAGGGVQYNPRSFELNLNFLGKFLENVKRIDLPLGFTFQGMPNIIKRWAGHTSGVKVIDICEEYGLIITGDEKGFARIWNFRGHYIGMLGEDVWNLFDSSTYVYPNIPKDVSEDDRRKYETALDRKYLGIEIKQKEAEVTDEIPINEDNLMSNDEIREKARNLPVHVMKLPSFLKYENNKIVYRNSIYSQKTTLAPIFKHKFDQNLTIGLDLCDF